MTGRPDTSLSDSSGRPPAGAALDATALAAQYGHSDNAVVQRAVSPSAQLSTASAQPTPVRGDGMAGTGHAAAGEAPPMVHHAPDDPNGDEWFRAQVERNMDLITRRLEERMTVEFERRGGRMWGGL